MLNRASLTSSHLRNSHATFDGAHSEMRNIQRPDLRWGTNHAGECSHWAELHTCSVSRCVQSALAMHAAAMSLCLNRSPNNSAIHTSGVSVRLLYALNFLCTAQENVFSWPCCWLIQAAVGTPVVLQWPSLVASKVAPVPSFRHKRFFPYQVKSLIWYFIKEFLTSSAVFLVWKAGIF